jgi:hypothetical protein
MLKGVLTIRDGFVPRSTARPRTLGTQSLQTKVETPIARVGCSIPAGLIRTISKPEVNGGHGEWRGSNRFPVSGIDASRRASALPNTRFRMERTATNRKQQPTSCCAAITWQAPKGL